MFSVNQKIPSKIYTPILQSKIILKFCSFCYFYAYRFFYKTIIPNNK